MEKEVYDAFNDCETVFTGTLIECQEWVDMMDDKDNPRYHIT